MYRFSIQLGQSATADVVVADVIPATPLDQGDVGLLVGTTTGANGPMLVRYAEYAIEALLNAVKKDAVRTQYEAIYNPSTGAMALSAASTGLESSIAAALSTPDQHADTRSELLNAALYRCRDRFREELNAGNLPLLVQ